MRPRRNDTTNKKIKQHAKTELKKTKVSHASLTWSRHSDSTVVTTARSPSVLCVARTCGMPLRDLDPNAKKDVDRGRHAEKRREKRREKRQRHQRQESPAERCRMRQATRDRMCQVRQLETEDKAPARYAVISPFSFGLFKYQKAMFVVCCFCFYQDLK